MPHLLRGSIGGAYLCMCTPQSQLSLLNTGVFAQVSQHCVYSKQRLEQGSALIYCFEWRRGKKGRSWHLLEDKEQTHLVLLYHNRRWLNKSSVVGKPPKGPVWGICTKTNKSSYPESVSLCLSLCSITKLTTHGRTGQQRPRVDVLFWGNKAAERFYQIKLSIRGCKYLNASLNNHFD